MANLEHSTLTGTQLHEPKGVASAAANKVYLSNGAGSGAWSTPPGARQTEVIVRSASDFPTPSSNVIILEADTVYVLDGDIDVGDDRFVLSSNTVIAGVWSSVSSITSTTTGALFTASGSFALYNFAVTVASGTVFSCTGGAFESADITRFTVNSCTTIGTFSNWYSLYWADGAAVSFTNPLTLSGTCNILILDKVSFITGYTTAVDLDSATFNTCTFTRCGFSYASATNHIIIAAASANINTGFEGRIIDCKFSASATNIVTNYVVADLRWIVRGNAGLADTSKEAQGFSHNSTNTVISTVNTPVLMTTGTVTDYKSDQFTISTAGRFTYNGAVDTEFLISAKVSGTATSGTNKFFNHYIAKNGTPITASRSRKEYSAGTVGSPAPAEVIVTLSTNDYVEVFVENSTDANDWTNDSVNITVIGA